MLIGLFIYISEFYRLAELSTLFEPNNPKDKVSNKQHTRDTTRSLLKSSMKRKSHLCAFAKASQPPHSDDSSRFISAYLSASCLQSLHCNDGMARNWRTARTLLCNNESLWEHRFRRDTRKPDTFTVASITVHYE